jgi:hypothetical protein
LKDLVKFKVLWKEKIVSILVLVISFLVFSSPYLIYIKKETGVWLLTMKRSLSQTRIVKISEDRSRDKLIEENVDKINSGVDINKQKVVSKTDINKLSTDSRHKKSSTVREGVTDVKFVKIPIWGLSLKTYLGSVLYIMQKYLNTLHPFLFVFLIIGVINWTRIKKEQWFGFYITTIIVFYMVILYRLNIVNTATYGDIYQYPSRRHLMPLVIPAVFCVGIGVHTAGIWIHERFQIGSLRFGFKELLRSARIVQLIILVIVVGALLPKTLKPQGVDKLGVKKVGQWIRENSDKPSPAIYSSSPRNAYYAGGKDIQMGDINNALSMAREKKADYILFTLREYKAIETELLQSIKDKKIKLVYKCSEGPSLNNNNVFLYKMLY